MNSLRQIATLAAAFAFFATPAIVTAQDPAPASPKAQSLPQKPAAPPQTAPQFKITVPVNLVVVPVTVKDSEGRLVPDLHRDEFRIFEDNVEQNVDFFSADAFPLSIIILLDNDLKSKDAEQVQGSVRSIIAGMSAGDEAFICRFDQNFHPGKGFTNDQDKLLTELKRTDLDTEPSVAPQSPAFNDGPTINGHDVNGAPKIAGSTVALKGQPTKALDDAVYNAAELLKDRGRDRRKIILLISDGVNGGKKTNTNTFENTVKDLLRYDVSVYSVAVSSAFFDRKFSRLVDYAHNTGGDVYFAAKRATMEELYSRVTEEARNQYTLAYSPRGTDRGAEHHSIEVRVKREGLQIITREGYYAGAVPK